jgi:hypothetical protein
MKPALKGAGTKRLKLKYYKLLSNVPFKFNLRRHNQGSPRTGAHKRLVAGICRYCQLLHPTQFETSFLQSNGILA